MNVYLQELSAAFREDIIVLVADKAAWHTSSGLHVPENIEIIPLPPYTPEMNPIEQIWAWIRVHGFRNELFQSLENVIDRLCDTIRSLTVDTVKSVTFRNWIIPTI
jgi:putative transposase